MRTVSACLRNLGWRCVLDNVVRDSNFKVQPLKCSNRFEPLSHELVEACEDELSVDLDLVSNKARASKGNKRERRLRVATWNFSGLCSERKQKKWERF